MHDREQQQDGEWSAYRSFLLEKDSTAVCTLCEEGDAVRDTAEAWKAPLVGGTSKSKHIEFFREV